MAIAVACDGLSIAPRFLQCSSYMCYDTEDGMPVSCRNIPAFDQTLDKLPAFFQAIDADTLLAGQIDTEIVSALQANGIQVIPDCTGNPLSAVEHYLGVEVPTVAAS